MIDRNEIKAKSIEFVIAVQPSLYAGQIHRDKMKLPMAVDNSRHYVVDSVIARHFIQTAAKAGIARDS